MTELVVTAMVTLFLAAVILFWLDYRARKAAERRRKQAAASLARQQDDYLVNRSTYRGATIGQASRSPERRRQDNDDYWTPTGYDYGSSQIHERLVPRPDPAPSRRDADMVGGSFKTGGSFGGESNSGNSGFSTGGSFGSDSSGGYTDSGSSSSSSSSD